MTTAKTAAYCLIFLLAVGCGRGEKVAQPDSWEARYKAMDIPSTRPLSPQQALAAFQKPDGIAVELVAAEPLIGDPVAMDWDEQGRLYVVEMRGYMRDSHGSGETEGFGRVVRLEDRDGDGQMDVSEVFLDGLVNPRAIAIVNEGVLIAEPPRLWLCQLSGPDDVCEQKQQLGSYGSGDPNDVEHDENRLLSAANGWLYSAKSDVKRRLVDGVLRTEATAFRGQWGLSEDSYGRLYSNNNSLLLAADYFPQRYYQRFAWPDLGPDAGEGLSQMLIADQQVYSVRVNPGVNRADNEGSLRADGRLNLATSVSGLQYYRGSQLPSALGHVFVPEPAGNLIAQLGVSADGVQLQAEHISYPDDRWGQRDFLASTDERFRPVDLRLGPDGALYVIDMYRGVIQHHYFITDQLRKQAQQRGLEQPIGMGRIYRIRAEQAQAAPAYDFDTPEALLQALDHPDLWPRRTAARLLRKPEYRAALVDINIASLREAAQVQALWLKHDTQSLAKAEILASLQAGPALSVNALQLASHYLAAEDLLGWAAQAQLSPLQQLHLMATLAHDYQAAKAHELARRIVNEQLESPYFRRVYLSALSGRQLAEFELWFADHEAQESAHRAALMQNLSMAAFLESREDTSVDRASAAVSQFMSWPERNSDAPDWQTLQWLKGIATASKAENFQRLSLAVQPGFIEQARFAQQPSLGDALYAARAAFTWPGDDYIDGLKPLTAEQQRLLAQGEALYPQCAACHQKNGQGQAGLAPTLAGAEWVTGPPEWLARIILHGVSGPIEVAGEQWNMIMPGHSRMPGFDDAGVAGLLTYIRRSWGNKAGPVSVAQVAEIRAQTAERTAPWTVAELQAVPVQSPFSKYAGTYKVPLMPISMDVIARSDHIILRAPQGETAVKPDLDGVFSVPAMNFSFVFEEQDDGKVVLHLTRGKDKIRMKRKD